MMDDPATSDDALAGTFRDLARINRFLGGSRAVWSALKPLLRDVAATRASSSAPVQILDIGTGSGDIPRFIATAALKSRQTSFVQITATDFQPKVLALARRLTPAETYPGITFSSADARDLPFADGAFDIALCSLTLHHFVPDDCIRILREMDRVTTGGFVINDLERSRVAASLVALWARLTFANHVTRHDAPASVLRAYLPAEYAEMARAAGLTQVTVRRAPIYRVVLTQRKIGYKGKQADNDVQ
jgi:ubiquinone/menaquinone biosynthesis C-methylase UbiE